MSTSSECFRFLKPSCDHGSYRAQCCRPPLSAWLSVANLCSRQFILLAHPPRMSPCVSKTHHSGFWEHHVPHHGFFLPLSTLPSLCNPAPLLPCHSLIVLSHLSFESAVFLFHFLVLLPLLVPWCAGGLHACVVLQRPDDEQMWHPPMSSPSSH